jgi:hypothetical protein
MESERLEFFHSVHVERVTDENAVTIMNECRNFWETIATLPRESDIDSLFIQGFPGPS